jgi:predicted secreted Zn-dependent protease
VSRAAARLSSRSAHRLGLAAALALLPTLAAAQVVLSETRSDYVLHGASAQDLRDQLQRRLAQRSAEGGVISHGLTRAELETRYQLRPDPGGGCVLDAIEVRLAIDTQLPVWRPAARHAAELVPRVEAMLAGLARHEAGHRDNAIAAAGAIDAALRALPARGECDGLRRAAQRLVSRALIRLRVREWNYDEATGRGRRQGAVLELENETQRVPRRPRSAARR